VRLADRANGGYRTSQSEIQRDGNFLVPNIQRILAGVTARILGRLLDGQNPGDLTWLARTLYHDRDSSHAVALARFANAYYDIFYRNCSGVMTDNGETALLQRLSGLPLKTAVDVGANVGSWTMAMKNARPEIEIHAFEIMPATAQQMRVNIADLNGIKLNNFGLGDAADEIEIWYSPDNHVLTSAFGARVAEFPELNGTWQTVRAKVIRGDEYLAESGVEHVDFLKIDVEGMEMKVLMGFERTFARNAIDVVQFEYAPLNKYIPLLLRDLYGFFEPRGFVVGKVFPKGVAFKTYENTDEDFLGLTYVACRAERTDLRERLAYRMDR
jgi:FkbM family methyltransferase